MQSFVQTWDGTHLSIDGQIGAIWKVFRIHIRKASMCKGWAEGDKV